MSLLDIVEAVGEGTHKEIIPGMKGSFNVTIGDAVSGFYGSRHTHIFGADIKLVCDPEDLLMGKVAHYLPLTSALLAGIGGNATFVYAQNTNMIYGGPKTDIRRAPSVSKNSDFVLPHAGATPGGAGQMGAAAEIDKGLLFGVAALSTLVVAVPAVMELMIRFKYPQFGSSSASQETLEGYGETPNILKLCAYAVTSRLMDFLKTFEESGTWAEFGEFWISAAEYIGTKLRAFGTACIELGEWIAEGVADMAGAIARAAEAAGEAAAAAFA